MSVLRDFWVKVVGVGKPEELNLKNPGPSAAEVVPEVIPAGGGGKTVTLTGANFDGAVLKSSQPVLVDFWAVWSAPSKKMDLVIKGIAADFAGKVVTCKVNVDDNPEIAEKYQVVDLPVVLLFKDGQLIDRFVGMTSQSKLAAALKAL